MLWWDLYELKESVTKGAFSPEETMGSTKVHISFFIPWTDILFFTRTRSKLTLNLIKVLFQITGCKGCMVDLFQCSHYDVQGILGFLLL